MFDVLGRAKRRLLGTEGVEKRYECANCRSRLARQPFVCPDCGCYQVNWIGWQEDSELLE